MYRQSQANPVELSDDQRAELERWSTQGEEGIALRARIVLECATRRSNREVAQQVRVSHHTVAKWRVRFLAEGTDGLRDRSRSGAPRTISNAVVEQVLSKTLHEKPLGAERWSSRRLAAAVGVSQTTVLRIWRTFGLSGPRAVGYRER